MNTTSVASLSQNISKDILTLRESRPLVHNITNFVVMNVTANALLSLGASPIMAHAVEELPDLIAIASALVINIGTLDSHWIQSVTVATQLATERKLPIVLDPVGVGASTLRTQTALSLLENNAVSVIRGNASEIMALNQQSSRSKGVDSLHDSHDALHAAKSLSKQFHCVVVVSGKTDYCVENDTVIAVNNGHEMMTLVTGMGCTATAVIGAFLAVNKNKLSAAVHAMATMGLCGEFAAHHAKGPGTFLPQFLDALHHIDLQHIAKNIHISTSERSHV